MQSDNFTLLALTGHKFACRPRALVLLRDPVLALDFDLAAAARLLDLERAACEGAGIGGGESEGGENAARHLHW